MSSPNILPSSESVHEAETESLDISRSNSATPGPRSDGNEEGATQVKPLDFAKNGQAVDASEAPATDAARQSESSAQPVTQTQAPGGSTMQGPTGCVERTQKALEELQGVSCAPQEYNPNKFYTPEDPFMMPVPYGPCLFTGMPFLPKNIINKKKWEAIKERCAKLGITERMLDVLFQRLCSPLDEALGTVKLKRFFGQFAAENRRLLKAMVMDIAKGKQRVYFEDAVLILAEFCALDFVSLVYKFVKVVGGDEAVNHMSVDLMRGLQRYLWDNKIDEFNKLLLRHSWSDHPHHGVQAFVDFSIRYPCLIFPLLTLQRSVQRKILGRNFWEAFHIKQHTQLLPGDFGAEHGRMVAARVLMLEAVSEVCRPFQFGTPLTRSDPPPPTPRTLDPKQWDFDKLPREKPTPLRRAMSTTQFTRSSSSRLAGPAQLMRSNTAGRGTLATSLAPRSRPSSGAGQRAASAPDGLALNVDSSSDTESDSDGELLEMQQDALKQSRASTAVLDMHHVQLGKRAGGETATGEQVLPRRVRKMGAAAQAELGYVDAFQGAGAPDAGLADIKNMEKAGLSGADMAKEEREAAKRTEAIAAKLKSFLDAEGVLDVTKPDVETLKEILEDANLAADMSDYDKAKIIAAIHEKDQQSLGLSRVFFSLDNPSAYAAAAFAFSYYLSMQHRKQKALRQGAVSYSLPTACVAPTKAAYAKTHQAPHGARCVKNNMDIAQLVIVHATSGLGIEPTVVQAPCLFTGALIASDKQVVRPPTIEELAGDTSQVDRDFAAPEGSSGRPKQTDDADIGASVFSAEATGGAAAPQASEGVDSDRALRMLKDGALRPAEGRQVIRRLRGEAMYLPSAAAAGSRYAELVDADPGLGEFEALEKVRMREAVRRGERSKDVVIKFPMLVGAPPIKFQRPELNSRILARRCGHFFSRQAAYANGYCKHGWKHRGANWEWCQEGGCTAACAACAISKAEATQRTCTKCAKRVHLKCSVWYALTLGRLADCVGGIGAALCELGRSCVYLSKEVLTDCCLSMGATCENCCCRARQRNPKRVQPGAAETGEDDADAALRREVAALDKNQDIERYVDSKHAASLRQGRDTSNFADRRRQREIAKVKRKMPRGGFVAPARSTAAAAARADDDGSEDPLVILPRRVQSKAAATAGGVGDPKEAPADPRPRPPSAAGDAKAASEQPPEAQGGADADGMFDAPPRTPTPVARGDSVRFAEDAETPPRRPSDTPTSPLSTGARKRRASERALLRVDTSAELVAEQQAVAERQATEDAAEAARHSAEQADRRALAALSRSVSTAALVTPSATPLPLSGAGAASGTLDPHATRDAAFERPPGLQRQPSQIDMAGAALGEALGGLELDLPQTSTHTVVDPHSSSAVLDLSTVSAARQRAEHRKVNPKAKPRGALYPASKLVRAAPLPSAAQLPEKKFNTGFCAEADFYIFHVLAGLYGYKVATAIAEASAAPQSNDVIIAQHEVAARATGQSLVKFHKDGERNGYMFHDDVWVELYDEEAQSFFYHNLATGSSLPFGQAPPAYKEFNPSAE